MNLSKLECGECIVENIGVDDESVRDFLLTLGCYEGERITVINKSKRYVILSIKDGRYCIDNRLASLITVKEVKE